MKYKCYHLLCLFVWLLLFCLSCCADSGSAASKIQCIAKERDALLQFKHGIEFDEGGMLTSWVGQECCVWHGIRCNNSSDHVISLDVSGTLNYFWNNELSVITSRISLITSRISPSLVELKQLEYLDLSNNDFEDQPIPSFIGSLLNLKHLDLSCSNFVGEVPHQLANLSSLTYIGLGNEGLNVKDLRWLSHLTLLTNITLKSANLSLATDWIQTVNNLPLLKSLHIDACSLPTQTSLSLLKYTNSSTTLDTLSLQHNDWKGTRILEWVSNFTRLSSTFSHLDLSSNGFSGPIPSSLGNIHSPLHLDLSKNSFEGLIPKTVSNLKHLVHLDLSQNNFEGLIPKTVSNLKHLVHLDLSQNNFEGPIPQTISNLKHLVHLDLSFNRFEGPISETISNLKHLVHLDLSANKFQGIKWNPDGLGSLCRLQMLYLEDNNITSELSTIIQPISQCVHKCLVTLNIVNNRIWGSLSDEIGTFSSLRELDLQHNQLNGTISPSLGQLSMLETLDLSSNSLKCTFSNHHLSNLSRLTILDLSNNAGLVFNISANWVPPFQLDRIRLGSCKLGPYFPKWLLTQAKFSSLDISNSSISDTIPSAFWSSLPHNLQSLSMSGNMIHGDIPDVPISWQGSLTIDLGSNLFHGSIPSFLSIASELHLNDNNFSDCALFFHPRTQASLNILSLTNNKLSGELPSSWGHFDQLYELYLDGNKFSGSLPSTMGKLTRLYVLHLHNNNISGKFPIALRECRYLVMLDLSHNSLTGALPNWFGHVFNELAYLSLRGNDFRGGLPLSLCEISTLQILDISTNDFTGFIPKCIHNLTSMIEPENDISDTDSAWVMWKREESNFGSTLSLVKAIDMSNNKLEGPIPDGISRLVGLISLDLSRNRLNGSITPNIGQLTSLEYLDLSRNKICGEIPLSLSTVSSLGTLDLSYNNLSGRIPHGTQLQGFSTSSYIGNPGLCGDPLPRCPGDPTPANSPKQDTSTHQDDDHNDDDDNDNIFPGLYISVVFGFIVGFWGVCGTLVIKRSWRHTFFKVFDDIKDRLYTLVVVNKARVLRRNP